MIEASRSSELLAPAQGRFAQALRSGNLCVVGNINRDLKTSPIRSGEHLLQDGETSVGSIIETIGGGGANSACIAAALGARIAFLGKVGTDELGRRLENCLNQHGVVPRLVQDGSVRTGTSLGLSYDTGHRHFVSSLPNNCALRFEDLPLNALDGCNHLYRADIWFSEPMLFGGNERLFKETYARGMKVSIDLNWDPVWLAGRPEEVRRRKQAVRALLPLVDLAHGNARELQEFADAPDLETALKQLGKWGVKAVDVHLGAKGAGYYERGKLEVVPAVRALKQVHATGTGDVLSVCLMLLYDEKDVRGKLQYANQVVSEFIEGSRQLIPALD